MGLTIHYDLTSRTNSSNRARQLIEKMRQLAMDLPFDKVDDKITYLTPEFCQTDIEDLRGQDDLQLDTLLDASTYVEVPWAGKDRYHSVPCHPVEGYHFWIHPGPGCEWAGIGLVRFPKEIEVTYRPQDDGKFTTTIEEKGCTRWEFNDKAWRRWCVGNNIDVYTSYRGRKETSAWHGEKQFQEKRIIKTKLGGWRLGSFCKTQYSSSPDCGGIHNFIRCHVGLITLLDRIAELPTVEVEINDEGHYGRSHYTDDPYVDEPVYTWHDGKYDVKALVEQIGSWNEMIAAAFGRLKDAAGDHGTPNKPPSGTEEAIILASLIEDILLIEFWVTLHKHNRIVN